VLLEAVAAAVVTTLPPGISESSGLVTSSTSDTVLFTHEDSGAAGDVQAVSTDGRLLATFRLGEQARDWEDVARGPGEGGRSSLFLADIGDNNATRDNGVLVHRVPEPAVDQTREGVVRDLPPEVSYRLRYEDGPRDAETLLVHPGTGRLYVVTKGLLGTPRLYAAPAVLAADAPNVLEHVADVDVERTGTPGGPGLGGAANVLITAGDISPDGRKLAVRTYTDLYEWWLDGDLADAVEGAARITPLPPTPQGEGLAYTRDGTALLTTSEGEGAPVHRVPSALTAAAREPADRRDDRRLLLGGAAVLAAALAGASVLRRRRRTHR